MIHAENINKSYALGSQNVQVLYDLSFQIQAGEFVAIMGSSGSGKSTLMNILGCLDVTDSGLYSFQNTDIASLNENERAFFRAQIIGFVFQQFHLLPKLTALENVLMPRIYAAEDPEIVNKAKERLETVGLGSRMHHKPTELSGGEQQRVSIARALLHQHKLLLADEPTGNLDSKSEASIIEYFKTLHQKGTTIVVVTHDQSVAKQADRILHLRDGKLIEDSQNHSPNSTTEAHFSFDNKIEASGILLRLKSLSSHLSIYAKEALNGIFSRKLRSFLSVLGILIGIASVIAVVCVGMGAQAQTESQLSSLGSNVLSISPGSTRRGGETRSGNAIRFDDKDMYWLATIPEIKAASALVYGGGKAIFKNKNWDTRVIGTHSSYATMRDYVPDKGRFFTKQEVGTRQKVAVIGTQVAEELFGDINPVGLEIKINRSSFQVIGVLAQKSSSGWDNPNNQIILPITTAMYRLLGRRYYNSINVEIDKDSDLFGVEEKIKNLLLDKHNIRLDRDEAIRVFNLNEFKDMITGVVRNISFFLYFSSFIALLVGGIGIMNIMLVSVTERTKEIGIRKAMGARASQIKEQFLMESVVLTLTGGFLGVLCGIGIAVLISSIAGWAIKISWTAIVVVTVISIAIGIIFGLWPAVKASKLHPVQALRID